jgi:putative lipase involved disintegration of autophagic bodies
MWESIITTFQIVLQQKNELKILVTCHSMGGAMASFYAFYLTIQISLSTSLFVK